MSKVVHVFAAITQYRTCQQLVEWLGVQVTKAAAQMAEERRTRFAITTPQNKTAEMTRMSKQLEANGRIEELEELKHANELLVVQVEIGQYRTIVAEPKSQV